MAKVVWTTQALMDLEDIRVFIAQERPIAAERLNKRLRDAALKLDRYPHRGRPIDRGRRELAHVPPYLIRYRIEAGCVVILEVRHGAREAE